MKISSKKLAVVTGGNDALAGHAHTARLTHDVARHVLGLSCTSALLTTYLHSRHRHGIDRVTVTQILHWYLCQLVWSP